MISEPSKVTLLFFLCRFHAFAFSLALTEENWKLMLWCFRKLPNFHSCHIVGTSMGKTHKIVKVHSDLPPLLALFCDITQRVVVIHYPTFRDNLSGPTVENQEIFICCVTSQKTADLVYFVAEAWNQSVCLSHARGL
jgi:hypothetical protein